MIIRILSEGQYELAEDHLPHLNTLDTALQAAVEDGDPARFATALDDLLTAVRTLGVVLPDHVLTPSELVLPAPDASLSDVLALLGDEGLIPG